MTDPFAARQALLKARQADLEKALQLAELQSRVAQEENAILGDAADMQLLRCRLVDKEPPSSKSGGARVNALKRYFDAMSNFPDYHERRRARLSTAAPFSFEQRELTRPKSTSTRRVEEEAQRRLEQEERELRAQFRANPVPPTTFVPKYEIMVEEWCARKEALRILAERQAEARRVAALPGQQFASAMMASKPGRKKKTPEEAFEEWKRRHCRPFTSRSIPKSVVMPKMAEMQLREQDRKARIAARAEQLLLVAQAPPRMERALSDGNKETLPPNPRSRSDDADQQLRRFNKQLTFAPNIKGKVPRYEECWAKERLRLELRRQSRPLTRPAEFDSLRRHMDMSVSAAQEKVKRRAASAGCRVPPAETPQLAAVLLDMSIDEAKLKETRWPHKAPRGKVASSGYTRPPPLPDEKLPTATRAHTLKAETAFRRIVSAEETSRQQMERDNEIKEKQRRVNQRMAAVLAEHGLDRRPRDIIAEEARRKRKATAIQTREYNTSIAALKEQLDAQPPRFIQDAAVGDVARKDATARTPGDSQIIALLKQHGLGERSLRDVMLSSHAAQLSQTPIDVVVVTEAGRDVPPPPPSQPDVATIAAVRQDTAPDRFEASSSSSGTNSPRGSSSSASSAAAVARA